ncbi:50S ribosomal protein L11 methyltransferase [Abyssisolibacter fermentans]|uniref:50S ribosomal protein L11 methyltransferase n=1 Tax=Abyssisolibacter fermentans TaxID=1766203 RepID=UPI00083017E7|nr:50S ribosomal protein L11 methyltransferase [Abyssisolibacter fermentans]
MKWIEVQIKTTTEAVEIVSNILYEVGIGGLVIEDPNDIIASSENESWDYIDSKLLDQDFEGVIVKGYFEESEDLKDKIELIKENVEKIPQYCLNKGLGEITEVTTTEIENQDWSKVWKKYYKPKKIGEKVVIKPSWEKYQKKDDELIIEIDPGTAFGTGTHETTIMCIRQLEKHVHNLDTVIDVGCGTGVLSIGAAKLGAISVVGVDLDEECVKVARENVRKNGVANVVQIKSGNMLDNIDCKANIVVANIVANIINVISKDIDKFLEDDGVFIASGIIIDKLKEVKNELVKNGLKIIDETVMGEWACVVSKINEVTYE